VAGGGRNVSWITARTPRWSVPGTRMLRDALTVVLPRDTRMWSSRMTDGIHRPAGQVKPGHGRRRAASAQSTKSAASRSRNGRWSRLALKSPATTCGPSLLASVDRIAASSCCHRRTLWRIGAFGCTPVTVTGQPSTGSMRARGAAATMPGTGGKGARGQRAQSPVPPALGRGSRWQLGSRVSMPASASRCTMPGVSSCTTSTSTWCRSMARTTAAGSAEPPRTFKLRTRSVSEPGPGPGTWGTEAVSLLVRLAGGSCHARRVRAGIESSRASHQDVAAATATPANATSVASGASAASRG
jgi:hypothetical protein